MTGWGFAALAVMSLTSIGVSTATAVAMAREHAGDTAVARRRARRQARIHMVVVSAAVVVAANLWLIGAPGDAAWVVPLAALAVTVTLVAFQLALRLARRRDPPDSREPL